MIKGSGGKGAFEVDNGVVKEQIQQSWEQKLAKDKRQILICFTIGHKTIDHIKAGAQRHGIAQAKFVFNILREWLKQPIELRYSYADMEGIKYRAEYYVRLPVYARQELYNETEKRGYTLSVGLEHAVAWYQTEGRRFWGR